MSIGTKTVLVTTDGKRYVRRVVTGDSWNCQHPSTAHFGLGKAQAATLPSIRMTEALETLTQAFDYYETVADIGKAVAVAEHYLEGPPGLLSETVTLGARALELVPPDSHDAGRILSRQGFMLARELADFELARDALGRALSIARREHDVALETRTLGYSGETYLYELKSSEALEESLKAVELARRSEDRVGEAYARHTVAHALCLLGRPEEALSQANAAVELAERLGNTTVLVSALWVTCLVHYLTGQWQAVREVNDRALQLSPRGGRILGVRVALEYQVGNWDEANEYFRRHLDTTHNTGLGAASLAYGMQAVLMALGTQAPEMETDLDQARALAGNGLLPFGNVERTPVMRNLNPDRNSNTFPTPTKAATC